MLSCGPGLLAHRVRRQPREIRRECRAGRAAADLGPDRRRRPLALHEPDQGVGHRGQVERHRAPRQPCAVPYQRRSPSRSRSAPAVAASREGGRVQPRATCAGGRISGSRGAGGAGGRTVTSIVPIDTRGRPETRGFWCSSPGSGPSMAIEREAEAGRRYEIADRRRPARALLAGGVPAARRRWGGRLGAWAVAGAGRRGGAVPVAGGGVAGVADSVRGRSLCCGLAVVAGPGPGGGVAGVAVSRSGAGRRWRAGRGGGSWSGGRCRWGGSGVGGRWAGRPWRRVPVGGAVSRLPAGRGPGGPSRRSQRQLDRLRQVDGRPTRLVLGASVRVARRSRAA